MFEAILGMFTVLFSFALGMGAGVLAAYYGFRGQNLEGFVVVPAMLGCVVLVPGVVMVASLKVLTTLYWRLGIDRTPPF